MNFAGNTEGSSQIRHVQFSILFLDSQMFVGSWLLWLLTIMTWRQQPGILSLNMKYLTFLSLCKPSLKPFKPQAIITASGRELCIWTCLSHPISFRDPVIIRSTSVVIPGAEPFQRWLPNCEMIPREIPLPFSVILLIIVFSLVYFCFCSQFLMSSTKKFINYMK